MGYNISLRNNGKNDNWDVMTTAIRHQEGGNYVAFEQTADGQIQQGTADCDIHVTGNYSKIYERVFPDSEATRTTGLKQTLLISRTAEETIPVLERAVKELGTERHPDYWKATDGNAGRVLNTLLGWAREHPNGVWWVL